MGIARQDGMAKGDPRDTFVKDLRNRGTKNGSGGRAARIAVQAVTIAWNAFCEKRELTVIRCVDSAILRVWGTPYQNGNCR